MTAPDATTCGTEETDAAFRLAPQQQRLFLTHPDSVPCLSLVVRLNAVPDETQLAARWTICLERLEILRTACRTPAWSRLPLQYVEEHVVAPLIVERLADQAVNAHLKTLCDPMADPTVLPGVQARLILTPSITRLHLSGGAHVVDGDSLITLAQWLLRGDVESEPLQFPDIAEWAASLTEDADATPGLAFWQRRSASLHDAPVAFAQPVSADRRRWAEVSAPWPAGWTETPPTDADGIAIAQLFAARCAAMEGAAIAVRSDSRDVDELANAIGPLARWLPLPGETGLDAPFSDWRSAAKTSWTTTRNWQHLMEAGLGDGTAPEIAIGIEWVEHSCDGEIEHRDPEPSAPSLIFRIDRNRSRLSLIADTARHDFEQAARMARMAATLAEAAASPTSERAGSLDWIDGQTQADLIAMGAGSTLTVPADPLLDRIAQCVFNRPDAIAVIQDGRHVSYRELWSRAGAVAASLPAGGPDDERPVAVRLTRGADALAAMLGAWRAGRPYTLCDPALPKPRIDEMLRAAGPAAEVSRIPSAVPASGSESDLSGTTGNRADLAYLLFTSGSTGTPKAVAVTQAGLAASTAARTQHYGADPKTFLVVSPLGFDSSVAGLYWTLATGGTVILPSDAEAQDASALARLIRTHAVSHTLMLPGLYDAVLEAAKPGELDSLELVVVAGEDCPPSLPSRHRERCPDTRLENEYGPTEGTVWCTAARLDAEAVGRITIGSAVPGTYVRVVDRMLQPVPPGIPGEIIIGGAGLARGYHGRPAETAARFVPDPSSTEPGARIYQVGDRGMLTADGRILYRGRIDNQVKIRGHRVELEEIEAHLQADPRVHSAVIAVQDGRLIGYLVLRNNADMGSDLQAALSDGLPEWMTPQAWVVLEKLPRGATGKLDRAALPDPDQAQTDARGRAPRNDTERAVAAIWADLLKVASLSIDDNFFHLGGDSLVALRVATRMRDIGIDASPRLLLKNPTIADLIEASPRLDPNTLRQTVPDPPTAEAPVPLTQLQAWLLDRAGGVPNRYNQTLRVTAAQPLDLVALERAFQDVVHRHDALRLRFEQTPNGWRQTAGPARTVPPLLYDLARVPEPARAQIEAGAWERLHSDLDPAIGRNTALAVIRRGPGTEDLLLAVVHHLSIDAASWQVVMQDLETAYRAALAGKQPRWAGPAGSFAAWIAATPRRQTKRPAATEAAVPALPIDHPGGSNSEGDVESLSVSLDRSETDLLSRLAPGAFGSGLDAVLTATLADSLAEWSGQSRIRIDREQHGRDTDPAEPTTDGVVGWFTVIEPITFEIPPTTEIDDRQVRLNALVGQADAPPQASAPIKSESEVLFNFLGRTDLTTSDDALFRVEAGPVGRSRDPHIPRHCLLEIDAEIFDGQLKLDWHYARTLHDRPTIERLAADHLARLTACAEDLNKDQELI